MTGLKNFLLRGSLVETAVAFIMATAFAAVITATVAVIMDIVGKVGGVPDFSTYSWHGVSVGAWLTALISFVVIGTVVYFFIVVPYSQAKERFFPSEEPGTPEDVLLLQEIRDLLAAQRGGPTAEEQSPQAP